jgi:hypothetical protein
MKPLKTIALLLISLFLIPNPGDASPGISFEQLVLRNEQDPHLGLQAKLLADRLNLPKVVYIESGVLIDALGIENGQPVYAVMRDLAHPFDGGTAMSYSEVVARFDLSSAVVNPSGPVILDRAWRAQPGHRDYLDNAGGYLLVPEWTADKVMAFDPMNGNLLDTAYIHSNSIALASPKEARLSPRGTITVSDQITDLVQDFDTTGAYLRWFAPAGGVNTAILDNIRGHAYRPNGNLIVTVASGANQNCIAEFDSAGNYIGQFIVAGAGGLNSPFCILYRSSDILITTSSAPQGVLKFDLNGAFQSIWASITSFPQQIIQLANGNFAIANFSGTGQTGIRLHAPDGTFLRLLTGVTGNRGVFQLGNGNFLTTNAAGIHEIDSSTGALVRTIATASNMQYINLINRTLVDVEEKLTLPTAATLHHNFPNPFNPSTTIAFSVGKHGHTSLAVYNLLGQEVATLVNEELKAGSYQATFDATGLASGVYFYRLKTANFVDTKKLMLLR